MRRNAWAKSCRSYLSLYKSVSRKPRVIGLARADIFGADKGRNRELESLDSIGTALGVGWDYPRLGAL